MTGHINRTADNRLETLGSLQVKSERETVGGDGISFVEHKWYIWRGHLFVPNSQMISIWRHSNPRGMADSPNMESNATTHHGTIAGCPGSRYLNRSRDFTFSREGATIFYQEVTETPDLRAFTFCFGFEPPMDCQEAPWLLSVFWFFLRRDCLAPLF